VTKMNLTISDLITEDVFAKVCSSLNFEIARVDENGL